MSRHVTAAWLLEQVREFGPSVDGCDLVFDHDVPAALLPAVRLLQTGLRALLTGKKWFSNDADGRGTGPLAFGALEPRLPIPLVTVRLTVEGDPTWDAIRSEWKDTLPNCFVAEPREERKKYPSKFKTEGAK